jgi:hypothetical protein
MSLGLIRAGGFDQRELLLRSSRRNARRDCHSLRTARSLQGRAGYGAAVADPCGRAQF